MFPFLENHYYGAGIYAIAKEQGCMPSVVLIHLVSYGQARVDKHGLNENAFLQNVSLASSA